MHLPVPSTPSEQSPLPSQALVAPPGQTLAHRAPYAPKQRHCGVLGDCERSTVHEPNELLVKSRQRSHWFSAVAPRIAVVVSGGQEVQLAVSLVVAFFHWPLGQKSQNFPWVPGGHPTDIVQRPLVSSTTGDLTGSIMPPNITMFWMVSALFDKMRGTIAKEDLLNIAFSSGDHVARFSS